MKRRVTFPGAVVFASSVFLATSATLDGTAGAVATNFVQLVVAVAATVASHRTWRTTCRSTWKFMAMGAGSFSLGQLVWTAACVPIGDVPADASVSDVPFLLAPAFFAVAMVSARRAAPRPAEIARVAADSLLFLVAGGLVLGQLVEPTSVASGSTIDWLSTMAFPLADFLLLVVATTVLPTTDTTGRRRLALCSLAFACLTVSDVAFAVVEARGGYESGGVTDLGWLAAFVIIAVLAREADETTGVAPTPSRLSTLIVIGFPYVPVVALALLGAHQFLEDHVTAWTALGGVVVGVLVLVREILLHIDVLRLQETLAAQVAAAQLSQSQYWRLVESTPLPIVLTNDWVLRYANPAAQALLGWTEGAGIVGSQLDPRIMAQLEAIEVAQVRDTGTPIELRVPCADGTERDLECYLSYYEDEDGFGSQVIGRDITERRRSQDQLERNERRWRSLVQNASDLVLVVSPDATVLEVTPAAERILGFAPEEGIGKSSLGWIHEDDLGAVLAAFDEVMRAPDAESRVQFRARRKDGRYVWLESRARNLVHDDAVNGIVCNIRDIDAHRSAMAAAQHQALHDNLTGLANRRALLDHLAETVGDPTSEVGLLLMDLDGFKDVNDGLGHEVGDLLLVEVGRRLLGSVRTDDVVARLGGDEFAIVLHGVPRRDAAEWVAQGVLGHLRRPFHIGGVTITVGASIGVVATGDDGTDVSVLLRRADVAMYHAKRNRLGVACYDESFAADSATRLALAADLRTALEERDLQVVFQPKLHVESGRIVGAEALARWTHPVHGAVSPAEFVALAEQAGLIGPLTDLVLEQALANCRNWQAEGFDVDIAVNLSPRLLADRSLHHRIGAALERSGVPARCVTLEVTESAFAEDTPAVAECLHRLHEMGVQLSIDDFGTGYSSMAYLKRLPIDELKIDRSFVLDLDDRDRAIVRAVVEMGHRLGLVVVAEGVETAEALAELRSLGCDLAQGYHVMRPLPAADFTGWLAAEREVVAG